MFKIAEEQVDVLGICIDAPRQAGRFEGIGYHGVTGGRRAMDLLRMVTFDFVLVGGSMPDMSPWEFLRNLKVSHPHQKWALVAPLLTEQQEVTARMFGATTLFDSTPTTHELLNLTARMRQRAAARVLNGGFGAAAAQPMRVAHAF